LSDYLSLAEGYTRPHSPCLCLVQGVSGSGKSRLALALRARLPLIHLRSDIERKRLFGFLAEARTSSGGQIDGGIYGPEAGERTYGRLRELAGTLLMAGYSPLVDATFLKRAQRETFIGLAQRQGCPCHLLICEAPLEVLQERVRRRAAEGADPSEAGVEVLASQLALREPLTAEETSLSIPVDTTSAGYEEGVVRMLATDQAWVIS
jgi:hypothetical protein